MVVKTALPLSKKSLLVVVELGPDLPGLRGVKDHKGHKVQSGTQVQPQRSPVRKAHKVHKGTLEPPLQFPVLKAPLVKQAHKVHKATRVRRLLWLDQRGLKAFKATLVRKEQQAPYRDRKDRLAQTAP